MPSRGPGRAALGLLAAGMLLAGACAPVGPNYTPPVTKAPDAWHSKMEDGLKPGSPRPPSWPAGG